MLYEVLGDIWVVHRNPYSKRTCSRTEAPRPADRGAEHRLADIERGATGWTSSATSASAGCSKRPARRSRSLRVRSRRSSNCGARRGARSGAHARRQRVPGSLRPGVACDRRDRLARRDPFRRAGAGHRGRGAGLVRECVDLGLTIIPRGAATGYTGSAVPLTPFAAIINTRKFEHVGPVAPTSMPGVEAPVATVLTGRASSRDASRKRRTRPASYSRSTRRRPTRRAWAATSP